ncbi:host-nuclease inhibitor Gam family protein [Alkaliphilus sp. B6464]|uniref:host-nuclease inhibitor Gam family protein n=1 Tax=Alkaliphilus sp. B6464 TaxID=2731219 RepID=UPI001BA7F216|nr:host-nuclease inhibitor Gam family protein [Alkaliphilus sp. B6464]QUH21455.1 host-nuclease inhibitor Gam family protein [Alkaliphilus sp. B6464]
MNRLQLAEIQEVETVEREGYKIENKQSAEWALRKIKVLKEQIEETDQLAEAEIERIKAWQESENKKSKYDIARFEGLLLEYMVKEREKDPETKSIKLPHGTVRFRKQPLEYVRDEENLIKWAKGSTRADLIKVKESFDWSTLKKDITVVAGNVVDKHTGEIIEHVKAIEREDKFEVVMD